MKINILPLTLIFLTTFLACCKDEDDKPSNCGRTSKQYYDLTEEAKSKTAYTGQDTLQFINGASDTATLYGQGKVAFYYSKKSTGGSVDCPTYMEQYWGNNRITFKGPSLLLPMIVFSVFKEEMDNPLFTVIGISLGDTNIADNSMSYIDHHLSAPEDSIFLNGVYEKGIFIDNYSNKTTLFNYSKGLLRFKDANNNLWTKSK